MKEAPFLYKPISISPEYLNIPLSPEIEQISTKMRRGITGFQIIKTILSLGVAYGAYSFYSGVDEFAKKLENRTSMSKQSYHQMNQMSPHQNSENNHTYTIQQDK